MASRLNLHEELCEILGSRNVYFQPPESIKLVYPCIVYERSGFNKLAANDAFYRGVNQYHVVVIERDPDSEIPNRIISHFPMCNAGNPYTSDNLNHTPFNLYY